MTGLVTLSQIRTHCRIDDQTDDALLADYLAAAEEYLAAHRTPWSGVDPDTSPALYRSEVYRMVMGFYENRGG